MKYIGLLLVLVSTVALADPPASYMKTEMDFEPPLSKYSLKEFTDNAFKNVASKQWLDMGDEKWLLSIVGLDPKTKRESRMKFIFGKTDTGFVAIESIVSDGQDITEFTEKVVEKLMGNVQAKLGVRQTMEQFHAEQEQMVSGARAPASKKKK